MKTPLSHPFAIFLSVLLLLGCDAKQDASSSSDASLKPHEQNAFASSANVWFVDGQDKINAEILLYCKNGGRSTLAAHTLKRMGFSNVKMLVGGYDGWEGHTVETDPSVYK